MFAGQDSYRSGLHRQKDVSLVCEAKGVCWTRELWYEVGQDEESNKRSVAKTSPTVGCSSDRRGPKIAETGAKREDKEKCRHTSDDLWALEVLVRMQIAGRESKP